MRIYVAAPWVQRWEAAAVAAMLVYHGHTITHDWWNHEGTDEQPDRLRYLAGLDFTAVCQSDLFVLLNLEKSEGKAVETGVALARHNLYGTPRLVGVGPRYTNIFQYMPEWEWFATVADFLASPVAAPVATSCLNTSATSR